MVSITRVRKITRTSRAKLIELENKFKFILNQFVNKNISPKMELTTPESLRAKYEVEIKPKIRAMVEEAYKEGNEQVAREIRRVAPSFDLFTSKTDVSNMDQKTDELNNEFWNTITWVAKRRNEFLVKQATQTKEAEVVRKPEYDQQAALAAVATGIAFQSFNKAIKTKARVVQTITQEVPLSIRQPTTPGRIITFKRLEAKIMFLTREDRDVDLKICMPLNRTVYDVGDPSIPEPIRDTHKHCRCQLVPLIDELAQTEANSLLL